MTNLKEEMKFPTIGEKITVLIYGEERLCTCVVMDDKVTFIYKLDNGKYKKTVVPKTEALNILATEIK